MAHVKKPDQVEEFLDDLLQYTEEESGANWDRNRIDNGEIWVEETEPIAIAITEKYLMLADSQDTVEDIIANLKSPPSRPLSMRQDFEEAQNSLPKDRMIFVFAPPDAMASAFDIETYLELGEPTGWTEADLPKYTGGPLTFIDKGIRMDMVAPVTDNTYQVEPQAVMATAKVLPEDTLAMASTAGIADTWADWLDWLEANEEGTAWEIQQFIDNVESETGVNLKYDVIKQLKGGIAIALLPSIIRFKPETEEFTGRLQAVIVAETDDVRRIEGTGDELAEVLERRGYDIDQDWIEDDKLITVNLTQFDERLRRHKGSALFTEGWISLGTTRKSVIEVHDTLNVETRPLASSERFSKLAKLMPDPLKYVAYVDIAGIQDMLSDGASIDPYTIWVDTERPLIGNQDSLILGTSLTEEKFRMTMVLTFEEQ